VEPTGGDVDEYIAGVAPEVRRRDAGTLVALMRRVTGEEPVLWGSIVGFGRYHYRYDSGHEGDAALASFAPRKTATVIYLAGYFDGRDAELVERLGPVKTSKGCLYVKRLDDVDRDALRELIDRSIATRREADRAG